VGALEHDPEKWKPVFRKDHAPPKYRSAIASIEAVALQSMIPKRGNRFSEEIMLIFGGDHAQM
jgi:hypothetical protein